MDMFHCIYVQCIYIHIYMYVHHTCTYIVDVLLYVAYIMTVYVLSVEKGGFAQTTISNIEAT